MLNDIRFAATTIVGFVLLAFLTLNLNKLAENRGWDNFLVHSLDALFQKFPVLRWERLQKMWWLWSMLGLIGGVALSLWLTPIIVAPQANGNASVTQGQAPILPEREIRKRLNFVQSLNDTLKMMDEFDSKHVDVSVHPGTS
jgi:hypothetical protein